ncbi:hypothetical protein [Pedobacter sp. MR22-3]|uniref:hypothetical protein n=1 Tax=Pedobacter sp. MR22-3 TaxID=2994552 RepID=UPI002246F82F|nr:hypothetical protein [Pedobacter sp. MR22-3]MCX2584740.1 hypothetical protein [Pedobacter sp. MR22-3]
MKKPWYKKDFLFYPLIMVISAGIYFLVANLIALKDTAANPKPLTRVSKKLRLNDSVLRLKNITDTNSILNSFLSKRNGKNIALVLIDGGCSVCLQTLFNWKSFIDENHIDKDRIVFIGYDASLKQLNYSMKKVVKLDCKMYIDNSYLLGTLNKIGQDSDLKTLIIDKAENILIQKDPFVDTKIKPQFVKLLRE